MSTTWGPGPAAVADVPPDRLVRLDPQHRADDGLVQEQIGPDRPEWRVDRNDEQVEGDEEHVLGGDAIPSADMARLRRCERGRADGLQRHDGTSAGAVI